jgi:hypothetical protein
MDQDTKGSHSDFADYWGERIMADNLNPLRLPDALNPTSLTLIDVANTADQFAAFLNHLQVHMYQLQYCLRVKHSSNEPPFYCFFYPQKLFPQPVVTKEINHKSWLFSPIQNQATLNQCSAVIIMG